MMRPATRRRAPMSGSQSYPAPIYGWNARDDITNLQPGEAEMLDNWFPNQSSVQIRGGSDTHATGLVSKVETLMPYHSGTSDKMLAAAGANIYDVTAAGAVGAALASSLGSAIWQWVNHGTAGGQYLVMCNGVDAVRYYNGTAITTTIGGTAITGSGLTNADLINVNSYKRRLFFCEKQKLRFWYLDVNALVGTALSYDLSGLCRLGGYLMAMATWTRDGGDGMDDLAVFLTSNGEVLVFQGSDPADANDWAMIGRFEVGSPIGRRCFVKYGGELVLITRDGFLPLSPLLASARTDERLAVSDKIRRAVAEQVALNSSKAGWEAVLYPQGNYLLFNIPQSTTKAIQYVMNSATKAWCSFSGWNAFCFALFNDVLYFGGTGAVHQADVGHDDDGGQIVATAIDSPQYFSERGRQKRFTMVRPVFRTKGGITPRVLVSTDFRKKALGSAPSYSGSSGTPWGSPWGSAWGDSNKVIRKWVPCSGYGYNAQLNLKLASRAAVEWLSTDWTYEVGDAL